jgi:hypothetical protein
MAAIQIKAKTNKEGISPNEASVSYDFGEDVNDAIKKFGGDVVYSSFVSDCKITVQAAIRRMLEASIAPATIAERMAGWKPGVAMGRVSDPVGAMLAQFPTMSKEEQQKFISDLKKAQAGG